jgi:hypothetical protein
MQLAVLIFAASTRVTNDSVQSVSPRWTVYMIQPDGASGHRPRVLVGLMMGMLVAEATIKTWVDIPAGFSGF